MGRVSVLLTFLALAAACRHLPPDKGARAVVPAAQPVRRIPAAGEISGPWVSRALRGAVADLGHTALYVFGPEGRYTGALVTPTESVPIEGRYSLEAGKLSLDGGDVTFDAALADGILELTSPESYLELVPLR